MMAVFAFKEVRDVAFISIKDIKELFNQPFNTMFVGFYLLVFVRSHFCQFHTLISTYITSIENLSVLGTSCFSQNF